MSTPTLSIFQNSIGSVIGALNSGLAGRGAVAVHASSKGMRIALNGRTLAKGRTPEELHQNFQAEIAKAVAGTRK